MAKDAPAQSSFGRKTTALKAVLDTMPGAIAQPMSTSRSAVPGVILYKIFGKMFAILSVRGKEFVILKCDPPLAEIMREQYDGVGHRSHLDKRFWISVSLDADVPAKEVRNLVRHSYDQVAATLTRKQQAELAALAEKNATPTKRSSRQPRRGNA